MPQCVAEHYLPERLNLILCEYLKDFFQKRNFGNLDESSFRLLIAFSGSPKGWSSSLYKAVYLKSRLYTYDPVILLVRKPLLRGAPSSWSISFHFPCNHKFFCVIGWESCYYHKRFLRKKVEIHPLHIIDWMDGDVFFEPNISKISYTVCMHQKGATRKRTAIRSGGIFCSTVLFYFFLIH